MVSSAVEGLVDEAVARRLINAVGAAAGPVYGKKGKDDLRARAKSYNRAARFSPWLLLVDLNDEQPCAPALREVWLPTSAEKMCLRVAVRSIESWLIADRERFAAFVGVAVAKLPFKPDELESPKRFVITLAQGSRKSEIRDDMVPRPGGGRLIGPLYTARLIEFATSSWQPGAAASYSPSLRSCLGRLKELVTANQSAPVAK